MNIPKAARFSRGGRASLTQCLFRQHPTHSSFAQRTITTKPTRTTRTTSVNAKTQPTLNQRAYYHPRRTRNPNSQPNASLDPIALHRLEHMHQAYWRRRMKFAFTGLILTISATFVLTQMYPLPPEPLKNDAPADDPLANLDRSTPVIKGVPGAGAKPEGQNIQVVPTGTSHVPHFPKTLHLSLPESSESSTPTPGTPLAAGPGSPTGSSEYHLMGLGIRTVSFLRIQVYVVGVYVAVEDVAKLQQALIRCMDPQGIATTLIQPEKRNLHDALLDPVRSEEIWTRVLADSGIKSVLRVVPTRSTDFQHLRDGWVRNMTARTTHFGKLASDAAGGQSGQPVEWLAKSQMSNFDDDAFATAMQDFKAIFSGGGQKNLAKGKPLLLARDPRGTLHVYEDADDEAAGPASASSAGSVVSAAGSGARKEKIPPVKMGSVTDPRVANLLWLVYLAGKTVASEPARESVVQGVMEYVERPIGTVVTQVV